MELLSFLKNISIIKKILNINKIKNNNEYPVILVHGLFGWGSEELTVGYWGYATKVESSGLPIFEAAVGPVSSFHDRACELLAQIKGTRVDYGKEHSELHGHARYGKDFTGKGFHPSFSKENPVHLVGHSAGGNTIRMAQYLLSIDYHGWGSDADWIKSISCISAVLNGTALPYFLGCDWKTGMVSEEFGKTAFLTKLVKVIALVTNSTKASYDFDLEQWGLSHQKLSLKKGLNKIKSMKLFKGKDNLAYDLTFQGCWDVNSKVQSHKNTFYFGYGTSQTFWNPISGHHIPTVRMSPIMTVGAKWQGSVDIVSNAPTEGWGEGHFTNEQWWENDGCVPIKSQYYPLQPTGIDHLNHEGISDKSDFTSGVWYWEDTFDKYISFDHLDITSGVITDPISILAQQKFYVDLWKRLSMLR